MKIEAAGVTFSQVTSMARELVETQAEYNAVEAAIVAQIATLNAQADTARAALSAELQRIEIRIHDCTERLKVSRNRLERAQELRKQYG